MYIVYKCTNIAKLHIRDTQEQAYQTSPTSSHARSSTVPSIVDLQTKHTVPYYVYVYI